MTREQINRVETFKDGSSIHPKKWYTSKELQEMLGVHRQTLYNYRVRGLKCKTLGGSRCHEYLGADIIDFISTSYG